MYEQFKGVRVERQGAQLRVTLDSPPMNAMTKQAHTDLSHLFRVVARDPEVRVVVITGAGEKGFSAGGDINNFAKQLDDHVGWVAGAIEARELVNSMLECDKPVIARINGHAVGVGCTIALCCDITIMVETAKIGDTHVKVGLACGDGGALIWPHLVGMPLARRYLLSGDLLTGCEAADIGLVTMAVPAAELDTQVNAWAERFVNSAPMALNTTKRALNMALRQQAQVFMDAHMGLETYSKLSSDHGEAVHAFLEKREPKFTGR